MVILFRQGDFVQAKNLSLPIGSERLAKSNLKLLDLIKKSEPIVTKVMIFVDNR